MSDRVIVHVVAFEPRDTDSAGTGGFDWYHTAAEADAALVDAHGDEEQQAADSHVFHRFDALVTSKEAATEEIDRMWEDWAKMPHLPQPVDCRANL